MVGAARDPTRWADWADIIILVREEFFSSFTKHQGTESEEKYNHLWFEIRGVELFRSIILISRQHFGF